MNINKCKLIFVKEKEYDYENLINSNIIYKFLIDKLEINKEPEEVVILFALDNKKKIINCCEVARGVLDSCLLSPRDIYKRALVANARYIVIAHNHPSGSVKPSIQDIEITKQLKKAGDILDIKLLDHIIVGEKDYYSFFEQSAENITKIDSSYLCDENDIKIKNKNKEERSL